MTPIGLAKKFTWDFLDSLRKNLDKFFGQPNITNFLPCLTTLCVTVSQISFSPHPLCSRAPPLFSLWLHLLSILSARDAPSWFSWKPSSCHSGLSYHVIPPSHQSWSHPSPISYLTLLPCFSFQLVPDIFSFVSLLFCCCPVTKSCPTFCDPQGLQHARLPCPSPSPGNCSNSWPLSRDAI